MRDLLLSLTIIVLLSGCSTLQTSVRNDVDWPAYTSVSVAVTPPDRWELRTLISERLADWGLVPVDATQQPVDLAAVLEVTEGSSLAETGDVVTWPKNLLLRLYDRSNGIELARSSYQLAPTQSAKHGLTLMVNDLRKHTSTTGAAAPPLNNNTATAPVPTPAATASRDERASDPAPPADTSAPPSGGELSEPPPASTDWAPRFKGWQPWGDNTTAEEPY